MLNLMLLLKNHDLLSVNMSHTMSYHTMPMKYVGSVRMMYRHHIVYMYDVEEGARTCGRADENDRPIGIRNQDCDVKRETEGR
jgi:hypothetical protein